MKRFLVLTLCLLGAAPEPQEKPAPASAHAGSLKQFLGKHCMDCHDADSKKGELDLSALAERMDSLDTFSMWVKIHDRVQGGEMPPAKKAQPSDGDRSSFLKALDLDLAAAISARQKRDGRAELRRLNRVELENTLKDLLGLPGLRIKESLPEDGKSHGFDRLASALDISFVHVDAYLSVLDKVFNDALCPFPEKPPVFTFRYKLFENNNHEGREADGWVGRAVKEGLAFGLIGMKRDETFRMEGPYKVIDDEPKSTALGIFRNEEADFRFDLNAIRPVVTGIHKLRVSGYSVAWDGKQIVPTPRHGAISFGVYSRNEHYGTVGLPPNKAAVAEVTAWCERGGTGAHGPDDHLKFVPASVDKLRGRLPGPAPGLAIEWVEIEGPIYEEWPPPSHRALFGDLPVKVWTREMGPLPRQQEWPFRHAGPFPKDIYGERGDKRPLVCVASSNPKADADRLLHHFLRRAFRRPVTDADLGIYRTLVAARMAKGEAFQDAMIAAYRMALASPEFLLLQEPPGRLTDHALAQRLSYFLWSSMPDEALFALADTGELGKPDVLRAQTERMLQDPKGKRFVENFLGEWLNLRDISATQPDTNLYPEFMPWHGEAMVLESQAYFSELLKNDLGVSRFVKSDFAMLNEPLAELYGIKDVHGWEIRKVSLPEGHPRAGGFLTQGGVLKVTANGTTTSPVKRGAFVMERIMGIVPTPPPPGAGSIEPDVRGAVTVRQQLDQHRANPVCAGCHQKMDGYGFALESYDVIGVFRDKYRAMGSGLDKIVNGRKVGYHLGLPVDCAGTLPDGRAFKDAVGIRNLLAANPERLAKAFIGQLLVYATGGELTFADRSAVDTIVQHASAKGQGIRTLVHEVIQSETFRNK
jgi:hypothetical protein